MALFQGEGPQNLEYSHGLLHRTQRTAIVINTVKAAKTRGNNLNKGDLDDIESYLPYCTYLDQQEHIM